MPATCDSCPSWERLHDKSGFGLCRLEVLGIDDDGLARWPKTHGEIDWCGEHPFAGLIDAENTADAP